MLPQFEPLIGLFKLCDQCYQECSVIGQKRHVTTKKSYEMRIMLTHVIYVLNIISTADILYITQEKIMMSPCYI